MSIFEKNWEYHIDLNSIEKKYYTEFQTKLANISEKVPKQLEEGFKIQKFVYHSNVPQCPDEELSILTEKNKNLRQEIDKKLEAISQQQSQYESFKKDQQLLSQEIKETHESFLMAKKYYKKLLKMYHTIESRNGEEQTIYLQFFTEAKKDSENYSVRLLRNTKTEQYQLLETKPKLANMNELQRHLKETNDVPGALCSIRQKFITMKSNKKQ